MRGIRVPNPFAQWVGGWFLILGIGSALPSHGQWIEPSGTGWAKFQVAHQDTQQRFDENGVVESYFTQDARSITTTVRFTAAVGLWRGIDLRVDVPYHRLVVNGVTRDRRTTGLADPCLFVRVGGLLAGGGDFALGGGVKFPVGDFQPDAEQIALSQGQRDWELLVEMGKSLHPWPGYVMAWAGYRWRGVNAETRKSQVTSNWWTSRLAGRLIVSSGNSPSTGSLDVRPSARTLDWNWSRIDKSFCN